MTYNNSLYFYNFDLIIPFIHRINIMTEYGYKSKCYNIITC
jgi:hypothetical protein